ncbi:retropepsin-like aspartic protease [Aspergillus mulundensis]|uniref:Uncharacterized protein n=1 Tax=Aspergillus mulundensis TaxID=1810919 RepID=A0A3D8QVM5_9EURO|nr:hypothetical protein DSM5745_09566 [Aspergillus mulundensis]RDW65827.1 hypothetical protein DSM5745_09566 [Aspergillus mulundensis]
MPFPFREHYKRAACGFLSCCDRQPANPEFDPRYSDATSPPKYSLIGLRSWPKTASPDTQRLSWTTKRKKSSSARQQQQQQRQQRGNDNTGYEDASDVTYEETGKTSSAHDIELFAPGREQPIYRCVLLDTSSFVDAVSDEFPRLLNVPMGEYNGGEVRMPNGFFVKPVGTLEVNWKIYKGKRPFRTKCVVIKDSQFDMLLGLPSIQRYGLFEEDEDNSERLTYR